MAQGTEVTIASGESLSDTCRIPAHMMLSRVVLPADWTEADITFSLAPDGGTFYDVYWPSGLLKYEVGAPTNAVSLTLDKAHNIMRGVVKIRSGTPASPVAQGGDRTLVLYCDEI